MWSAIAAGLAIASLVVSPKAKNEQMQKAINKALAEREESQNKKKEEEE